MIKSYWLRLFLFALGGAVVALAASMVVKKKYEALVEIMIDQKPMTQSFAQSNAEQSVSDMLDFVRPRSLTTQVQQLTSFGIIREAARRVAQQRNLPDPMEDQNSVLYPPTLMDSLSVSADATSDIIGLRVRLPDPDLAQSVAREIYLAFVDQNSTNTRELAGRAIDFLKDQYTDIDKQIKAIDAEQVKVKTEIGSPDIQTSVQAEIANLNDLRRQRDGAMLDLVTARQKVMEMERVYETLPKNQDFGTSKSPNPLYQNIQSQIYQAETDKEALLKRYTEERDEVRAVQAKIDGLKNTLVAMKGQEYIVGQSSSGVSGQKQTLQSSIAEQKGLLNGFEKRYQEASKLVDDREAFLKKLPAVQARLADLNRQQLVLERLYQAYEDRLKTLQAAKTGRVTPTREVTAATAIPEPVSPKVLVNTLFGIVVGLIFGVLSMLAAEAKRQPIRSLSQLNQLAFRPVYRLVPELRAPFRGLSKAPPESFETLLANHLRSTNRPYRIAIVGLTKDSGASTTAINLAVAGARHGSRVLMVECDPRGSLARIAGKQPSPGEVVEVSPLIRGMAIETLLSLSGERNPEILTSVRDQEADLTIIDLEPTSKSAEYAFIAPHVDEVILLVRAGRTKSVEFLQAQQALKEAGCPQVTVAFTRSSDLAVVTESADATLVEGPTGPGPKQLDA